MQRYPHRESRSRIPDSWYTRKDSPNTRGPPGECRPAGPRMPTTRGARTWPPALEPNARRSSRSVGCPVPAHAGAIEQREVVGTRPALPAAHDLQIAPVPQPRVVHVDLGIDIPL